MPSSAARRAAEPNSLIASDFVMTPSINYSLFLESTKSTSVDVVLAMFRGSAVRPNQSPGTQKKHGIRHGSDDTLDTTTGSFLKDRVTEARESKGWQKAEFARQLGVTPQTVQKWEDGDVQQIEFENLQRIQAKTGYAAGWIATGEGPKHAGPEPDAERRKLLIAAERLPAYAVSTATAIIEALEKIPPK